MVRRASPPPPIAARCRGGQARSPSSDRGILRVAAWRDAGCDRLRAPRRRRARNSRKPPGMRL
jgi:hypothetical protein